MGGVAAGHLAGELRRLDDPSIPLDLVLAVRQPGGTQLLQIERPQRVVIETTEELQPAFVDDRALVVHLVFDADGLLVGNEMEIVGAGGRRLRAGLEIGLARLGRGGEAEADDPELGNPQPVHVRLAIGEIGAGDGRGSLHHGLLSCRVLMSARMSAGVPDPASRFR